MDTLIRSFLRLTYTFVQKIVKISYPALHTDEPIARVSLKWQTRKQDCLEGKRPECSR